MKSIRISLGLLGFAAVLAFTGCKKDASVPQTLNNNDAATAEFKTIDYQTPDLNVVDNPEVSDGINSDFTFMEPDPQDQPKQGCTCKGCDPLPEILKDLKLTSEQKDQIKGFIHDFKDCVGAHMKKIHEMHQQLMDKYNRLRADKVAALKNGKITKEQFKRQMEELRQHLLDDMKKLELKRHEMEAARQCREQLLKNIASVLDPKQREKFKHWVESHK